MENFVYYVFPFVSQVPYPKRQYLPVTIIEDGYLSRENLQKAGKDRDWLTRVLREKGADQQDTLLLTVDAGDNILWLGKEDGT